MLLTKRPSTKLSPQEDRALTLGRQLLALYETGYTSPKRMLWYSFLHGLMAGFGAVIGGTVVIALLLWFLSGLNELPFIGPISNTVRTTIQQKSH